MITVFTETAWEDYSYWQENDQDILESVNNLIRDIQRDSFKGIGKPEPLKDPLAGYGSRRMTEEHRIVYKAEGKKPNQVLTIIQDRYHYS